MRSYKNLFACLLLSLLTLPLSAVGNNLIEVLKDAEPRIIKYLDKRIHHFDEEGTSWETKLEGLNYEILDILIDKIVVRGSVGVGTSQDKAALYFEKFELEIVKVEVGWAIKSSRAACKRAFN